MGVDDRAAAEPLTPAEPRAPRGWLLLLLALLAVSGVYLPALDGTFLWDDRHLVSDGASGPTFDVRRAFAQPFWIGSPETKGSVSYFRPLTTLSLGLDRELHRDNPAGYHLTNIAAHLVATGLLFGLLRRRRVSEACAFVLALGWALLPRLTEGAAWISGRGDVLAGMFALGALLAYRPGSRARLALAAALALAATWCKEAGVAAFAALLVLELTGSGKAGTRAERLPRAALLAAPLLIYALSRFAAGAGSLGDGQALGLPLRAATVLEALGRCAFMMANPFQPRSLIGHLGAPSWPFVVAGGALALVSVAALGRAKQSTETYACLALGLTPLALVLHLTPLPVTAIAADRYLYLPSAGLLLAVAPSLQAALAARRVLWAPLALLVVALGVRTSQRVADYADDARFWTTALAQAPDDVTPLVELGGVAYRTGCFAEAFALYRRAVRLDRAPVSQQLGTVALVANLLGKRELAAQVGDRLIHAYPDQAEMQLRRATLAVSELDWPRARAHAERAGKLDPGFSAARAFLASLPELEQLHAAVRAGAPASTRLTLEMRTLRYPEAVATLRDLLEDPRADPSVVRQGIEFVVTRGEPQDASPLLTRYLRSRADPDASRLIAAAQLRFDSAASLRAQLRERGLGSK